MSTSNFVVDIQDSDMGICVMVATKEHYDAEGGFDCVHMSESVEPVWPKEYEMDELAEACFLIGEESDLSTVKEVFSGAGFILLP